MAMEDPQFSSSTPPLFNYRHSSYEPAAPENGAAATGAGGDLLFAWLTPIGTKVDKRLRPKSPQIATLPSPLNRARSAFRRTLKAGHVSHKLRVREANDACLWLKAAGFPQYVQMFEDGQFPINLSKFHVEKDHAFLEQADIDSLIRRLNILNRCADIMEETKSKDDDSDDECSQRALSDQWHFRRKNKKWSRRGSKKTSSIDILNYSSEDLLSDSETNTSSSSLMLVSELRNSLTGLDRAVKTYSFLPTDDQIPKILVDSPEGSPTTLLTGSQESGGGDSSSNGVEPKTGDVFEIGGASKKGYSWEDDGDVDSLGSMDNFANGILDEFESNLLKWKTQSLPDIFAAMKHYDGSDTSSETSLLSSASASTNSMAESSRGEDGQSHKSASQPSEEARSSSSLSSHQTNVLLNSTPLVNGSATSEEMTKRKAYVLPPKPLSEPVPLQDRHQRFDSVGSTGTFESQSSSLVGSEGERRESRGGISASPLPSYPERQYVQNELGRGSVSPVKLRPKRPSTGSEQQQSSSQARWHSYQQPHSFKHTFKPVRTLIPIEELSVGQISVLRKLSLVKLTALIELYKSKSNISRILKVRKQKPPDIKYKRMFGVPLSVNIRNTGQALPPAILHAIQHLRENGGLETKGLFRRAAAKAKIELLKVINEANPANSNYEDCSVYDIADMIKLYFRQLPEPVLTSRLSEMLIIIQQNVPSPQLRLQAFQSVMLLMPDGNREALQTLLLFLKEVASNSAVNQMDAQNLAVCLAPSLFALSSPLPKLHTSNSLARRSSFRRTAVNPGRTHMNIATSKEVHESVASSNCLAEMISHVDKLFTIAADMLQICKFTHLEAGDPVPFHELGLDRYGMGHYTSHLDECAQTVLKEARRKFKGWVHFDTLRGAEVSFLKPNDGVPLKTWRAVVEVGAPCEAVLKKVWNQRLLWTGEVQNAKVVSRLDEQTEVIQYVSSSPPPLSNRDHCLLRHWQYDVSTESYVIVSMSVSHPCASLHASSIRATELATRYLIEPLTKDSSRLTFISRVDTRGHSAEYYNQSYGPYLVSTITNVSHSFQEPDFLETTV